MAYRPQGREYYEYMGIVDDFTSRYRYSAYEDDAGNYSSESYTEDEQDGDQLEPE